MASLASVLHSGNQPQNPHLEPKNPIRMDLSPFYRRPICQSATPAGPCAPKPQNWYLSGIVSLAPSLPAIREPSHPPLCPCIQPHNGDPSRPPFPLPKHTYQVTHSPALLSPHPPNTPTHSSTHQPTHPPTHPTAHPPTSLEWTRVTKWKARTMWGWLKDNISATSLSTGTVVSVLCSMTLTATSRPAHLLVCARRQNDTQAAGSTQGMAQRVSATGAGTASSGRFRPSLLLTLAQLPLLHSAAETGLPGWLHGWLCKHAVPGPDRLAWLLVQACVAGARSCDSAHGGAARRAQVQRCRALRARQAAQQHPRLDSLCSKHAAERTRPNQLAKFDVVVIHVAQVGCRAGPGDRPASLQPQWAPGEGLGLCLGSRPA